MIKISSSVECLYDPIIFLKILRVYLFKYPFINTPQKNPILYLLFVHIRILPLMYSLKKNKSC